MRKATNNQQTTPRPEPTPAERHAQQIEVAIWTKDYHERSAKEQIGAAVRGVRDMLETIERETNREDADMQKILDCIRHTMAWGCANLNGTLDSADRAIREANVTSARLEILKVTAPVTPTTTAV